MEFIETPIFTRRIPDILSDDDYRNLQAELVRRPLAGRVIPGGGGLRKIRWRVVGKGKSGGARIIYYYIKDKAQIYMIYPYLKSEQEDLTRDQLKTLAQFVKGGVL